MYIKAKGMGMLLVMIILTWFNIVHRGVCETLDTTPYDEVIESNSSITNKCTFNHTVDCIWKINETAINIESSSNDKYVNGKSTDTEDYSITTNLTATEPNLNGTGISKEIPIFVSEKSEVILNCTVEQSVNCSWKLNASAMSINRRYKYVGGHNGIDVKDCSIAIHNVHSSIDKGLWLCYSKAVDKISEHKFATYTLLINKSTTTVISTIASPTMTIASTTVPGINNKSTTILLNLKPEVPIATIATTIASKLSGETRLKIYLSVACALTVCFIGIAIYFKRKFNQANIKLTANSNSEAPQNENTVIMNNLVSQNSVESGTSNAEEPTYIDAAPRNHEPGNADPTYHEPSEESASAEIVYAQIETSTNNPSNENEPSTSVDMPIYAVINPRNKVKQ